MTAAVPASVPISQFPWDHSVLGMGVEWYYFEQCLEYCLAQADAGKLLERTRDPLISTVATDAYCAMYDLAEGAWLRFIKYSTP